MKKIVFVEKQQSSTYDPVSTFFAKNTTKPSSVAKPPVPHQSNKNNQLVKQANSVQRPPSTKVPIQTKKVQQKQKPVTSKIGRKGQYMPPKRPQPPKKQQSIYPAGGGSKKNVTSKNSINQHQQPLDRQTIIKNVMQQRQQKQQFALPNVNQRRSPIKNTYNQQNINTNINSQKETPHQQYFPKSKQSASQIQNLNKRLKELQQKQDIQIEQFQQRYQKLQQKYNKLQKQHKMCGSQTKQTTRKLKQRQDQLKKLMSRQDIAYNKKREMLLQNQINNLKKINRELVMRIKNYKSTDLVQVSLMNNKTDILFKQYDHTPQEDDEENPNPSNYIDLSKIESMTYRTVQQIQKYIQIKNNSKQIPWVQQKKVLLQMSNYCKSLSLQCMGFQFKMPSSNKECINFYNQIEKYRHSLQPIIAKYDLNFVITQQNIQFINKMNENISYQEQFKESLVRKWTQEPKKFKKSSQASIYYLNKLKTQARIFEKNNSVTNIIVAHCLSQISYIQSWVNRMSTNLKQSLNNLNITLKQIQELNSLGDSGKESLLLYVKSNIGNLVLKMPDLEFQVKEIGSIFKKAKFNNTKFKGK